MYLNKFSICQSGYRYGCYYVYNCSFDVIGNLDFFKRKMVLLWIGMEWIRNYRLQNYIKQIIYDTIMILSYSLMLICNEQSVNRFKLSKNLVKSTTYWTAKCSKFIKEFIFFLVLSVFIEHQTNSSKISYLLDFI